MKICNMPFFVFINFFSYILNKTVNLFENINIGNIFIYFIIKEKSPSDVGDYRSAIAPLPSLAKLKSFLSSFLAYLNVCAVPDTLFPLKYERP